MTLLDTHAWIWWATESSKLSRAGKRAIEKSRQRCLADICLWEVAMLVAHGRLKLDRPLGDWLESALEQTAIELLPISPEIAVQSTQLGARFHGDPADKLIVASAMVHGLALVSADERLQRFPGVETVW